MEELRVRRVPMSLKATLALLAVLIVLASGAAGSAAHAQETKSGTQDTAKPPAVDAKGWAVADEGSGRLLAGKDPDKRLPIASTTKIMVALVALDKGVNLDEEVTVSPNAASYAGFTYSNIGLFAGDRVSVRELMLAALVPSATDAVYALAEHLGDGRVKDCVDQMNKKADELGLKNTHFENPAGLDSSEHYSSARDLIKITDAALKYPVFRKMVSTKEATITTQDRKIQFFTTNDLLSTYSPATGVKTGTTPKGGASLVSSAASGGESYIAVVLDATGDEERFVGSREILEYAFDNYEQETLIPKNKVYGKMNVPYHRGDSIKLASAKGVEALVGKGEKVERRVTKKKAPDSVEAGQKLGEVEVSAGGQRLGSTPLIAKKGYEKASPWAKARYGAGGLFMRLRDWATGLLK